MKSHSPTECELSANGPESSEGQDGQSTLVDDEELELRELQSGPNPLRCSAHLFSSGRRGCALCKGPYLFPLSYTKCNHFITVVVIDGH